MADNRDIRIIVGANIGKTKSVVLEDLKTVANQINSGKSVPRIAFSVNISKTKQNITNELNRIIDGIKVNNLNLGVNVGNQKVTALNNEKILTEQAKRRKIENQQIEQSQNNQKKLQTDLNNLVTKTSKYGYNNSKLFNNEELSKQFNEFQTKLKTVSSSGKYTKETLTNLRNEFSKIQTAVSETGSLGQRYADKTFEQMSKLSVYFSGAAVVTGVIYQVKQMIDNVKELDSCLVNIQMVTGDTYEQTSKLMKSYSEMGKELGATTVQVAESANEWLNKIGRLYRNI